MRADLVLASLAGLATLAAAHQDQHNHHRRWVWGSSIIQDGDNGPDVPPVGQNVDMYHTHTIQTPSDKPTPPVFLPPQADGNDERPVAAAGGNARKPWAQRVAEYEASLAAAGPTATPTPGSSPRERVLWRQHQSAASAAAAAANGPAPGPEAAKRWFAGGAPIDIIQDDTPANAAPNVGGRTTPNGEEQVHRPTFAGPPGTPPPSTSAPAPTTTARGRLLQGLLPPVAPTQAAPAVETPSTVTDSQRVADLEAQVQTLNQVLGQLVGGLQGMLGGGGLLHKRADDEDEDEVLEADGVAVDCEASPFVEGEDYIELPVIEKREARAPIDHTQTFRRMRKDGGMRPIERKKRLIDVD
ncbi:hypothetical protein Rhopal_001739-T1 [Rhodotorula paludigena]|uniref:Uncharacterized protein n=1 Tax=Rhodotorula paludigena TaxID=86838 RepID=A0AAV5GGU7_9BASI|nr:hypothetical protein Rhopal_001739-T1 [Rhodotorula paludigena]